MTSLRARPQIHAPRLLLLGVLLVTPLVVAVGLAWACGPSMSTSVTPRSGPAGLQVTMTGSGLPAAAVKVDIRLDTAAGALLKGDVPVLAGAGGGSFTAQVTAPTAPGVHLFIPVAYDAANQQVPMSPSPAVFQVTDASLTVAPGSGRAGSTATVSGTQFKSGSVELHWDSAGGPELGSDYASGSDYSISKQVTIPAGTAGNHTIVGVPVDDSSDSASTSFTVLPPPPPSTVKPGDSVGPAIAAAALTSGNGAKTVSKKGVVMIFCGQFDEPGVTGECSAKSAKKLKSATKSSALKLRAKSFKADKGKPVRVRFRLSRASMKMLKKARRVRMRGTVSATDSKGNASPSVTFGFTLKAPK